MHVSHSITFSNSNERTSLYTIRFAVPIGGLSEPRLSVPNEATAADLKRFRDEGSEVVFSFTPKKGKTYSMEYDMYKAFDTAHRYVWYHADDDARIANWEFTLDVSAYLGAGYAMLSEGYTIVNPRCEYEGGRASGPGKEMAGGTRPPPRRREQGGGRMAWNIKDVSGGTAGIAWELHETSDRGLQSW